MLLAREFVAYISRQLVRRLTPGIIETPTPDVVTQKIAEVITEELSAEDLQNDEDHNQQSQYSEYMRREGVSYQEMFRKIKNTLVSQRKIVKASGRDTGDSMKLSRHKIKRKQKKNRKNKNTQKSQRKIVKASSHNTGDSMKLSRDKITDITHKLV